MTRFATTSTLPTKRDPITYILAIRNHNDWTTKLIGGTMTVNECDAKGAEAAIAILETILKIKHC